MVHSFCWRRVSRIRLRLNSRSLSTARKPSAMPRCTCASDLTSSWKGVHYKHRGKRETGYRCEEGSLSGSERVAMDCGHKQVEGRVGRDKKPARGAGTGGRSETGGHLVGSGGWRPTNERNDITTYFMKVNNMPSNHRSVGCVVREPHRGRMKTGQTPRTNLIVGQINNRHQCLSQLLKFLHVIVGSCCRAGRSAEFNTFWSGGAVETSVALTEVHLIGRGSATTF